MQQDWQCFPSQNFWIGIFYLGDLGTVPNKNAGKDVKPLLPPQPQTQSISSDKSLTMFLAALAALYLPLFSNIEAALDRLEL